MRTLCFCIVMSIAFVGCKPISKQEPASREQISPSVVGKLPDPSAARQMLDQMSEAWKHGKSAWKIPDKEIPAFLENFNKFLSSVKNAGALDRWRSLEPLKDYLRKIPTDSDHVADVLKAYNLPETWLGDIISASSSDLKKFDSVLSNQIGQLTVQSYVISFFRHAGHLEQAEAALSKFDSDVIDWYKTVDKVSGKYSTHTYAQTKSHLDEWFRVAEGDEGDRFIRDLWEFPIPENRPPFPAAN